MVKSDNKPFYDFGSFHGVEILYIIIAGIVLICLLCCIITICYKIKKSKHNKTSNNQQNKNNETKFKKEKQKTTRNPRNTTIEMTNGVDGDGLNWKYSVKGQRVDATSYQSSLAKHGSHKTLPTAMDSDDDAAFNRIINDRKSTVTHNPLQKSVYSSSNVHHANSYQNAPSVISPSSYPYNSGADSSPYNATISPNSYPNTHSNEQVFSGSEPDTEMDDISINSKTKTRDESMDTVKEYAVPDTLTMIVAAARAKNHNQLHVNQQYVNHANNNISMQSIDIDMDKEPSPSPGPSMMNVNNNHD